jgi:LysM repeat protein
MQDIRLMAGEGPLAKKTVLQAIAVIRKQRRPQGVAEGLTEMDKSQTPPGRDTGPREGPEKIAKPITKEKMVKHALDALSKSMAKKDDKKKDVKESDSLMIKLKRAMVREGRVKELADDLKTLADAEFMKKYGKAKAAIRADMKRVDEATPAMPAAPAAPAAPAKTAPQSNRQYAKTYNAATKQWTTNAPAANPMSQGPAQRAVSSQAAGKQIAANNTEAESDVDDSDPGAYDFDHWVDNGMGSATPVLKSGVIQNLFTKPLNQVPPGAKIIPKYDTYQQQGEYAYPVIMGGIDQAFKVRLDQVPKGAKIVQAPQQGGALFKNLPAAATPATPAAPAPVSERKGTRRLGEAGISRLGKKDFDFRDGLVGDDETGYETQNEPELGMFRMGKPVEPNDAATKEFMAAFQGAGEQNADNSSPLEPGEFRTNDGRIWRFVTDPAAVPAKKEPQWIPSSEADSIASWKANNPGKSAADSAAASGLPKMRFDRATNSLVPVDTPVALDLSPKTKDKFDRQTRSVKPADGSGANANIDAATRDRARAYAAKQNAPATAAKQKMDWKTIYALNKTTIGSNPNLIRPGMKLKMPDGSTYAVQSGDNLSKIAAKQSQINELSTEKLAQYKTAAARDAKEADKAGDFKRGDKRFGGIVKATKKQFDNDDKKVDESRAARRALMARIVNSR